MEISVSQYVPDRDFTVGGASYIGAPRPNTAMFITKKVGRLIQALANVRECLVFAETGLEVPEGIAAAHAFAFSDNPQGAYALLTAALSEEEEKENREIPYIQTANGAYISKTAQIGANAQIEPCAVIGPGVVIGDHARILSGAVIRNAVIGDHFIANEHAVIGANGFTMAKDAMGNNIRVCSLGKVRIGNNVEIGANNNVSRGSGGDTVIEDSVKTDALIHIGHDVHLHRNVEITAGAVLGGYVEAFEGVYIGINAVIRNRVTLGAGCFVGMGANVTKAVEPGVTVAGNPARPFEKR